MQTMRLLQVSHYYTPVQVTILPSTCETVITWSQCYEMVRPYHTNQTLRPFKQALRNSRESIKVLSGIWKTILNNNKLILPQHNEMSDQLLKSIRVNALQKVYLLMSLFDWHTTALHYPQLMIFVLNANDVKLTHWLLYIRPNMLVDRL